MVDILSLESSSHKLFTREISTLFIQQFKSYGYIIVCYTYTQKCMQAKNNKPPDLR